MFSEQLPDIDYKELARSINQLDIWKDLLGHQVMLHQNIVNPFRVDNHPNCWLDYGVVKSDYIVLNDFADSRFHGMDMYQAVMHKHKFSFGEAFIYIYRNYYLNKDAKRVVEQVNKLQKTTRKHESHLSFIPFNGYLKRDKAFWNPLSISSEQLESDGVYSVYKYRCSTKDKTGIIEYKPDTFCYAYTFPKTKHTKLYMPFFEYKWISNTSIEDIGMYEDLPESGNILLICKSYKDARIAKNLGFNVIWVQNERIKLPIEVIHDLASRFNHIYIFYDNDETGIREATLRQDEYNHITSSKIFKAIYLPVSLLNVKYKHYITGENKVGITDNAEYITVIGKNSLQKQIHNLL